MSISFILKKDSQIISDLKQELENKEKEIEKISAQVKSITIRKEIFMNRLKNRQYKLEIKEINGNIPIFEYVEIENKIFGNSFKLQFLKSLKTDTIRFNIIPDENFKFIRIVTNDNEKKYNLDIINYNFSCLKDITDGFSFKQEFNHFINTKKTDSVLGFVLIPEEYYIYKFGTNGCRISKLTEQIYKYKLFKQNDSDSDSVEKDIIELLHDSVANNKSEKIDKVIDNFNMNDEEILKTLSFKVNNTPIKVTHDDFHDLYNIEQTFKLNQINSSPTNKKYNKLQKPNILTFNFNKL